VEKSTGHPWILGISMAAIWRSAVWYSRLLVIADQGDLEEGIYKYDDYSYFVVKKSKLALASSLVMT